MRPDIVTTAEMLKARGATNRKTLYTDVAAGLFDDLRPRRTSAGRWSCEGVWLEWPPAALRRARLIRRARQRGLNRKQIGDMLASILKGER